MLLARSLYGESDRRQLWYKGRLRITMPCKTLEAYHADQNIRDRRDYRQGLL